MDSETIRWQSVTRSAGVAGFPPSRVRKLALSRSVSSLFQHRSLPVLAAIATALAVPPLTPAAHAAVPALSWRACPTEQAPTLECADLVVPVDRKAPNGPTVTLAVGRIKASDPAHRIGALVYNLGGPNQTLTDLDTPWFDAEIGARFDVVGWDPRGFGRSQQLKCDTAGFRSDLPHATSAAGFAANRAQTRKAADSCRQLSGPVFEHLDTAEHAQDLEALRVALGEERISYYGASYGTQIGQHYAERFGHRLRALALDSNMDHSQDATRFIETSTTAVEDAYAQFAAWCARTAGCALHGQDAKQVLVRVLAKAEAGRIPGWRHDQVRMTVTNSLYKPAKHFVNLAGTLAKLDSDTPPAPATEDTTPLEDLLIRSVMCQDYRWNVRSHQQLDALRQRLRTLAPTTQETVLGLWMANGCVDWPTKVTNPPRPLRVKTGTPKALVNAVRHDPSTPYTWSRAVHRALPAGSALLTYEGVGHGTYFRSPCAKNAILAYLLELRLPAPGASCPAIWPTVDATADAAPIQPIQPSRIW